MPDWLSKRVVLLALLLAVITSVATYYYLGSSSPVVQGAQTTVVVPIQNIPANTVISREMVAVRRLPEEYVHPEAVREVEMVVGKIATVPLLRDEAVLQGRLAGKDTTSNRFSYRIPDGQRAITIAVNEVIGVAGYPTVGDHVDLLLIGKMEGQKLSAKTFIQGREILATGQLTVGQEDGQQRLVSTITLCVSPEEAQQIALAEVSGSLRMVLRSPADETRRVITPTTEI